MSNRNQLCSLALEVLPLLGLRLLLSPSDGKVCDLDRSSPEALVVNDEFVHTQ